MTSVPVVLSIAGSDSGGGAGIQGDIKAIQACGGFAATVITAVTAQHTRGVTHVYPVPVPAIEAQLAAVLDDIAVRAIKTGMLGDAATIAAIARRLAQLPALPLVVDPVMRSKGGHPLLADAAVASLRSELLPLAHVLTPNAPEAEALVGAPVRTAADAEQAALRLRELGARAVVLKGGHLDDPTRSADLLVCDAGTWWFEGPRLATRHTHGTGCTFASALATLLALGDPLPQAVSRAKAYVTGAIAGALSIARVDDGTGHGPTDHDWFRRAGPPPWGEG